MTSEWSEQTVAAVNDPAQWRCLGSRHDRTDYNGENPLTAVLRDVSTAILLVMYPIDVAPMGPIKGDAHRLRPEKDYPVWRGRLPHNTARPNLVHRITEV